MNYVFHVQGMHCKSCVMMIEGELTDLSYVTHAKVSLAHHRLEVSGDFGGRTQEEIASLLNEPLQKHKYTLSVERVRHAAKWSDFAVALPLAVLFIAFFVLLQKLGIVNLVNSSKVGYGTAFTIGLIASVSTCMAIVGSLALSISANFAKEGSKVRPQMLFHIGRLIAFFVLGGLVGMLGSAFQLGATGSGVLGIIVALVLFVLGVNLLDVFPWMRRLQPTLPAFLSKRVHGLQEINHSLTPFLIGAATFFLPCGFTQSMQMYTLTTGSFWTGSLIMFFFALGTLPVLGLLSFGAAGLQTKAQSSLFFKTAGLVVIFFGVFNFLNSLAALGIINPIFTF